MPPTRLSQQPWHASLNIDLFINVLNRSVFHPFICCLVPFTFSAVRIKTTEPIYRYSVYWAILVCLMHIFLSISDKYAYGKPRALEQDEEIAVVTGGAGGLGNCIAKVFALKGIDVVLLDIKEPAPEDLLENMHFFKCNISDQASLEKTWKALTEKIGLPTILVNNAGTLTDREALDTKSEEVHRAYSVNVLSHYALNKLFLPPLIQAQKGGTLVTVSSILGRLGPAKLSAYSATKAALVAYHTSLTSEFRKTPNIKTILVTPGQLSSDMFASLRLNAVRRFFGPVVEIQTLATQIVNMVLDGRSGVISEPFYTRWIPLLDILPAGLALFAKDLAGLDTAMDQFQRPETTTRRTLR